MASEKNKPSMNQKPFFARFLEAQDLAKVSGGPVSTKYPSDTDETTKWPPHR